MLRRKPTRLELKLDDTEEFESVKKELEVCVSVFLPNGVTILALKMPCSS